MSKLSRELCLPACFGIGIAFYAYSVLFMPQGGAKVETADSAAASLPLQAEPQQIKLPPLKPKRAAGQSTPALQAPSQPASLPPLKPKPKLAARPSPEVTGAITPQAATGSKQTDSKHAIVPEAGAAASSEALPEVPGIRVASAAPRAVPIQSPDATRWSSAVGYAPLAKTAKPFAADRELGPPRAKRPRMVRRPYRMRPSNFRVVIGVGPRW